jgi:3-dehydroquinate synthase
MNKLIIRSLKIKKRVIEIDEFDRNYRNIMNYGHTFGHAIESVTNYSVLHGCAVTIGMDIANYLSMKLDYIPEELYLKMNSILINNFPQYNIKDIVIDDFFFSLSKDKKNLGDKVGMILTKGPGNMFREYIPLTDQVKNYFKSYFIK